MPTQSYIYWDQNRVLFTLGPVTIRWYGIFFMLTFLIGAFLLDRIFRTEKKPPEDVSVLILFIMVGTIVGARLGHCLFYHPLQYLKDPLSMLKVWKGGLASHGGAIGITAAILLYSRTRKGQSFWWLFDRLAIPIALGAVLVRVGNVFNSEIVGVPTTVPWGVVFARLRDGVARHPAQLYEAIAYTFVFVVLVAVYIRYREKTPVGLLMGIFLFAAFTARFFIEFLKERQADYSGAMVLRVGQLLSIPLVVAGAVLLVRAMRAVRASAQQPALAASAGDAGLDSSV